MKRGIATSLFVMAVVTGFAQSKPIYSQYILNNYVLNPALSGIENYSASEPHHGVGFIAINDRVGYINRTSVYGTYAYHRAMGAKTTLSAGFQGGISHVSLDRTKIVWGDLDPNDPTIGYANDEIKKLKPEVGAGLWLYSDRFYAGISALNIIPGKVRYVNDDKYGTFFEPNYFVSAGYRFFLNDDITVLPSAMLQYWRPQFAGIHGNVKLQYQDLFWIGGSYRHSDLLAGYSAMAGVNISNTFNVSYAYENATTSRLRNYTRNTHEIVVGFLLGNKFGDSCPRNVW